MLSSQGRLRNGQTHFRRQWTAYKDWHSIYAFLLCFDEYASRSVRACDSPKCLPVAATLATGEACIPPLLLSMVQSQLKTSATKSTFLKKENKKVDLSITQSSWHPPQLESITCFKKRPALKIPFRKYGPYSSDPDLNDTWNAVVTYRARHFNNTTVAHKPFFKLKLSFLLK